MLSKKKWSNKKCIACATNVLFVVFDNRITAHISNIDAYILNPNSKQSVKGVDRTHMYI